MFSVGGTATARFLILSVPASAVTLCPEGWKLGVNALLMVTFPAPTLALTIPCDAVLLGGTVAFQGGGISVPGGCGNFAGLALTDTVDVTIR